MCMTDHTKTSVLHIRIIPGKHEVRVLVSMSEGPTLQVQPKTRSKQRSDEVQAAVW